MTNDIIETIERDNNTRIEIYQDDSPESSREWSNLGVMVCAHRRYDLGDEQIKNNDSFLMQWYSDIPEKIRNGWSSENYLLGDAEYGSLPEEVREALYKIFFAQNIVLDLYLYDHSGITINTTGFSCPWDSGQVGYIYVSKETVKKEYNWKHITSKRAKQISEYLKQEVNTYDQYLTGDVYGFQTICNVCGENLDSCWGFYGHDWQDNGLLESAEVDCVNCKETEENLQMAFDFVKGV